ncbi:hypothetical protein HYW58_01310 [Candidatus Kaiserbacteria bacterium]|nr:hypothetical protein [Candidatus Kaiserbacteria bacterium]
MFRIAHVRKFVADHRDIIPDAEKALKCIEEYQTNTDGFIEGEIARTTGKGLVSAGVVAKILGKKNCHKLGQLYTTSEYQAVLQT